MLARGPDGNWIEVERTEFQGEADLQDVLHQAFEGILGARTDAPAVIVREASMPDHGRIDVLAVDADGVISICECKLASNADARRKVVGQVLEYGGWLYGMTVGQFSAAIESRLKPNVSLVDAMRAVAPDDWEAETWLYEVADNLANGRFQIMVVVDELPEILKQTLRYLDTRSDITVVAVELERARRGELELLNPVFFLGERARQRTATPSTSTTVENADTVVVAATRAWDDFARTGAYICQPDRSFRDGIRYLGFYARRKIEPLFPAIKARKPGLLFTPEIVAELRASGDPLDHEAADIIARDIADPESFRTPGEPHQIVLLDPDAGFELPNPIRHNGAAAWLRGQRYTSSDAVKTNPATTDELQAAGG